MKKENKNTLYKAKYPLSERLWFTKSSKIIADKELKKQDKYTIEYGVGKDRKTKTFKNKTEALKWITKNKKYFQPTAAYLIGTKGD